MKRLERSASLIAFGIISMVLLGACGGGSGIISIADPVRTPTQYEWLAAHYDKFHSPFDVFTDFDAAGNNFYIRNMLASEGPGDTEAVKFMVETCEVGAYRGTSCIGCVFKANPGSSNKNHGGWQFLNGFFPPEVYENGFQNQVNQGNKPAAGINLSGATELTFMARGSAGGEVVEFYCCGAGRDPETGAPILPYPDSSPKNTTGLISLSNTWEKYTINLDGKDISYVLCGFGWSASAEKNAGRDITFYIDDIKYNLDHRSEPHFAVSYEVRNSPFLIDKMFVNSAFLYDNCVLLMAFIAANDRERSKTIAQAILNVVQHDRYYPDEGRIASLYCGGSLFVPPGWLANGRDGTIRLPGWYNISDQKWHELPAENNHHSGDMAWAILALLAYYETFEKNSEYLSAAERIGEFIEANLRDDRGAGGYIGGFEGWESSLTELKFKSTEGNIDIYAAFKNLSRLKGGAWEARSNWAKNFVLSMWDASEGKFWTGTATDGITPNKEVIPEDVQTWAVMALGEEGKPYWKALDYVEKNHKISGLYDFNTDRDGVWYEGSAHVAAAYKYIGQTARGAAIVEAIKHYNDNGAIPAADRDGLTTGFADEKSKTRWLLYRRNHVGATAWTLIADKNINPFDSSSFSRNH